MKILTSTLANSAHDLTISARVKELDSFVGKVHRGDKNRSNEDVRDVVGLRVVCASLRDAEVVLEAVKGAGLVVSEVDRKAPAADELGYAGIHCFVRPSSRLSAPDETVEAELQIKTRAQDAWSVISHTLLYKPGGADVEPGLLLRRRVNRLSALTELFDDEVSEVIKMRRTDPAMRDLVIAEDVGAAYDRLVGRPQRLHKLGAPMSELLRSYRDDEDPAAQVVAHLADNADALRTVIELHAPASANYVDNDHWLLLLPESLVIAERAAAARSLLADVAERTAYASAIRAVAAAFGSSLPPAR